MRPISSLLTTALLTTATTFAWIAPAAAEAFTFRGQLDDGPNKAAGDYALRLTLYSHEGSTVPLAGPLELIDVAVNDGRFAVGVDFGDLPAHVTEGWLEVAVKAKNEPGDYLPLDGRSRVELKASQVCPASWTLVGNALTNPATNFLGTTDAQPLELRGNNQRVARFESLPLSIGHTANVLQGSPANLVDAGVRGATIAGGGLPSGDSDPDLDDEGPNRVTDHFGTIAGGYRNSAGDGAGDALDHPFASVSGGLWNEASGYGSGVGGGYANVASGFLSYVAGGRTNIASGDESFAAGGSSIAAAAYATVTGGFENVVLGDYGTAVGGLDNCVGGDSSWAGGSYAKVRPSTSSAGNPVGYACDGVPSSGDLNGDEGTFIWADRSANQTPFVSTGPNQFAIRAAGGVRLSDATNQYFGSTTRQMLNLWGTQFGLGVQDSTLYQRTTAYFAWYLNGTHNDAALNPGGGTLLMYVDPSGNLITAGTVNPPSDRNLKTAFASIDPADILARVVALPIAEWSYKTSTAERHLGPVAQDFHAAFGLGMNDTHISTVDADGVALAAIQGLNAKLEAEVVVLREELAALRAQVAAMQTRAKQ